MNSIITDHQLVPALLLTVSIFIGSFAIAQDDCIDYADFPNLEADETIPGDAWGLAAQGNHLFVAANQAGLQVVDITDPAFPQRISGLDSPGQARDVDCVGDLVYLADGTEGFRVISVTNPNAPATLGSLNTLGLVRRVEVVGNYAYLAVDWVSGGLMIMDVSNPAAPSQLSVTPAGGTARDVAVHGNHAYIGDSDGNIYVYDVTDPAAPAAVDTVIAGGPVTSLDISGLSLAAGIPEHGVELFDLTDPSQPSHTGSFLFYYGLNDLTIDGAGGFALNHKRMIQFDFSNPASTREMAVFPLPDYPVAVITHGDLIILAMDDYGIRVIRDNGFDLPVPVGSLAAGQDFAPGPFDIYNGSAFVASDMLYSVSVIDPENPVQAGTATTRVPSYDIDTQGPFAYMLAGPNEYLQIFNITNPGYPLLIKDFLPGGGRPEHLVAHGDYLYFGTKTDGLGIADISTPLTTALYPFDALWANIRSMAARGDTLFLGEANNVMIADITDRANPVEVGSIEATGNVDGITLQGRYVFLASNYHGLDIADLDQPGVPIIGHYPGWLFHHVTVHDGIAYVSDERAGVYVLDVTDPTQPELLGIKRGGSMKTMVRNDHLVVSGSGFMRGIEILPLQCKAASSVDDRIPAVAHLELAAYPNPFNPQTTFSFSLPLAGTVDMTVHDLNGRLVRRLVGGQVFSAGDHSIEWNGRDEHGRRLASGKYFGRLVTTGQQATLSVVLLK